MAILPSAPPPDSIRVRPTPRRLDRLQWPIIIVLIAGAYLVVNKLPTLFAPASPPAPGTAPFAGALLAVGLAVTVLSAGIVYVAVGLKGSFPKLVVALMIAYNTLIVLVKFVLGPPGIWHKTYTVLSGDLGPPSDAARSAAGTSAGFEAVAVFLLYAIALVILFVSFRLRTRAILRRLSKGRPARRFLAVPLASLFIFAGSLLFVGLFVAPALSGDSYIRDVFSSGAGVLAAVMLAGAITAAAAAFQLASERAVIVRDASMITAIFWLGLALLALYHVLWVVYILTLLAMWPVKFSVMSGK